jgi:hypothetical protein
MPRRAGARLETAASRAMVPPRVPAAEAPPRAAAGIWPQPGDSDTSGTSCPSFPAISCNLRTSRFRPRVARSRVVAGLSRAFESCVQLSENRGVPGSSPGLAIRKAIRGLDFLVSGAASVSDTDRDTRRPVFSRPSPDRPSCPGIRRTTEHVPRHELGALVAGAQCLRGVRRATAPFQGFSRDGAHNHASADAWSSSAAGVSRSPPETLRSTRLR